MKFKIGDRARVIKDISGLYPKDVGKLVKIIGTDYPSSDYPILVRPLGLGIDDKFLANEEELELLTDENPKIEGGEKTMAEFVTLTKEQELAFTKEQKALYRAGITDSYGSIQQTNFMKALLRLNYKALVAQAEADIAEAEAEELKKAKSK